MNVILIKSKVDSSSPKSNISKIKNNTIQNSKVRIKKSY